LDRTIDQLTTAPSAPNAPAFGGPRWNGVVLFLISVAGILAFLVLQVASLILIFYQTHPELLRFLHRYGFLPQNAMSQSALIHMLTAKNLWLSTVPSEVVLAIVTLVLARATLGITPDKLGLGSLPALKPILGALGVGAALVVITDIVGSLQNVVFGPQPQQVQALILLSHHGPDQFALDLMSVSIAAPFGEETFFRGLLFTGLAQRVPIWLAAAISAMLFSFAHFEKFQVLPIFVVGLGLAFVYYRTKSLWCSMLSHATFNGISLVAAYFFPTLVK
jgi:membrane protease YdiL (CAAX protease family)